MVGKAKQDEMPGKSTFSFVQLDMPEQPALETWIQLKKKKTWLFTKIIFVTSTHSETCGFLG